MPNQPGRTPGLSHRQRVRLALARQPTDRVPIALVCAGFHDVVAEALDRHLRAERRQPLQEYLDGLLDIRVVAPREVGPLRQRGIDIWGVRRKPVHVGAGTYQEIYHHPLASARQVADLQWHTWPSPDWFDYSELRRQIQADRENGDHCLMAMNGNPFETAWYMRGLERMLEDLLLRPELAEAILTRVTDFYEEYFRRILAVAEGQIDLVFTADDIGGQQGLLMSPETWRRFVRPCHVRLNRVIHQAGAKVIYHSDGAIMEAVPDLIEMGIDVLQALQFDAKGMDPAGLKRRYGDRLGFCGGISVQRTLPFGTPQDVRDEVRRRIAVLARGGGYILGPSHSIQAGTPMENILAMFEAAATTPLPS